MPDATPPNPEATAPTDWGNEPVPRAFAIGWQMAELYRGAFSARQPWPPAPERLPTVGELSGDQRLGLGIDQVTVALGRLVSPASLGPLEPLTTESLRALYEDGSTQPADGHDALYRLHVETLQTLSAADVRLGRAYSLGRALADAAHLPDEPRALVDDFGRGRLDILRAWLTDLATALPPHSAGAVLQSLTRWEAWAPNFAASRPAGGFGEDERRELAAILRRQGELWRAVLSGEKNALDMLSGDDYRRAASTLLGGARRFLVRTSLPLIALVAVLTAVVIALVVWLASNGTTRVVATLAAIAGGLGISWKSAGAILQRAAKTLERPLWGGAMNAVIAEAVTYLPPADAFKDRLLQHTPLCLRIVDCAEADSLAALIDTLRGRRGAGGAVALGDRLALRWWRARRRSPSTVDIRYWLNWALAAGYVGVRGGGYALTEEGRRLARIPRRDHDAVRATLSAARPSAAGPSIPSGG